MRSYRVVKTNHTNCYNYWRVFYCTCIGRIKRKSSTAKRIVPLFRAEKVVYYRTSMESIYIIVITLHLPKTGPNIAYAVRIWNRMGMNLYEHFMRIGDGICRIDQSRWLKSSFDHDEGVTRPVQRSGIERVLDRGSRQYRYRSWKEMENEVVLFHEVGGNRIVRMVLVHWISSCWCKRIFRWTK